MGQEKHGLSKTPEYKVWMSMKGRCKHPSHPSYPFYGGRGVKVCKRWDTSFAAFYADMGQRPEGLTLDRIDSLGDYTPENCRWTTWETQYRNKRPRPSSATGIKGVRISRNGEKYRAYIGANGQRIELGTFDTIEEAKAAREAAEEKYWSD